MKVHNVAGTTRLSDIDGVVERPEHRIVVSALHVAALAEVQQLSLSVLMAAHSQ